MKRRTYRYAKFTTVVLIILFSLLTACQGPPGPPGATGMSGPPGPPAVTETPEVINPVVIDAGEDKLAEPDATVTIKAAVQLNDGSTVTGYVWTQVSGVLAIIDNQNTDTVNIKLGNFAAYKAQLINSNKTLDRFTVQVITPYSLEVAETATFKVTVKTSSGSYSDMVNISAHLPYVVSPGIGVVPQGLPVLLSGKEQGSYNWNVAGPTGSKVILEDSSTQSPWFVPDIVGEYMISEDNSDVTIKVYAGTWAGVITGQDNQGKPLASDCTVCHGDGDAPDKFNEWKTSGHAEILTFNLNTSTHYGEGCFSCHSVGFNEGADNNGFDDASDYISFKNSGMINNPNPDNWTEMLNDYPQSAKLANVQCESCHGPNRDTKLHGNGIIDTERVSISSDVCAVCHGEPPRHARYQQWEDSGHANYQLAIEEAAVENRGSTAGHCGRCHSGQGFIAWSKQEDLTKVIQGKEGNATVDELTGLGLTEEAVHPQTCATCHEPHNPGTTSGDINTATVRIEDNTSMLPSGFNAIGVGRGAICIVCHNTRNGVHNDSVPATLNDLAPHVAAQGDVLMGENAYFIDTGDRSPHSYIEDTCTTCHMELTPPPPELSYQLSGTNHDFNASLDVCSNCHGSFNGGTLQESTEIKLEELKRAVETALSAEISAHIEMGHVFTLKGFGDSGADINITDSSDISNIELLESHGRMAMNLRVDGISYENIRITSDTVLKDALGKVMDTTLLSSDKGQIIAKAGWNYFLLHGDGSRGIHNPSFTLKVINASLAALK